MERSLSDRFLKRSESSLSTFIGTEIATENRFGKLSFQIKKGAVHQWIGLLFTLGTLWNNFCSTTEHQLNEWLYSFDQHNRLLEEIKRGRLHLSSDQFFTRLKSLFIYYCVEIDL